MYKPGNIQIDCLIVDDEPMARDVIRRYIEQVPSLRLVQEFGNAVEAADYLLDHQVDIIFLDIQMPQLNGTDFVRSLRKVPKIIFTTAFKEFAYEGFELDVIDYLLKPIRFERFLRAVNKALPKKEHELSIEESATLSSGSASGESFIDIRADRKMVKVQLNEIWYIESDKDYVKLHTKNGFLITRQTIGSIESMLPERDFIRIHRSYIVSIRFIKSYTNELVEVGNKELPIGKLFRNQFLKMQRV